MMGLNEYITEQAEHISKEDKKIIDGIVKYISPENQFKIKEKDYKGITGGLTKIVDDWYHESKTSISSWRKEIKDKKKIKTKALETAIINALKKLDNHELAKKNLAIYELKKKHKLYDGTEGNDKQMEDLYGMAKEVLGFKEEEFNDYINAVLEKEEEDYYAELGKIKEKLPEKIISTEISNKINPLMIDKSRFITANAHLLNKMKKDIGIIPIKQEILDYSPIAIAQHYHINKNDLNEKRLKQRGFELVKSDKESKEPKKATKEPKKAT